MADKITVEKLLAQTKAGEDEHRERTRSFDRAYEIYRASEQRPASLEPWRSRLRVRYAQQVLDTTLVNICGGKPRVVVRPRHPNDEAGAKAMQVALDYYANEDHLVEKQPPFVQQALLYGVTVAKVPWLYREGVRRGREFSTDPFTGQALDQHVERRIVVRDGPSMEPWNAYDAWWTPGCRDVDSASYVVLRAWPTKEELERERFNPDTGRGLYQNLDELYKLGPGRRRDETAQERRVSSAQNRRKDAFEIWEVWTDDALHVIGNRSVLLRSMPNPYYHNHKPVVVAQTRPDLFEMQGIPDTELVADIQDALWTLQNMVIDNLHLTVMRGITYREGGVTNPNALVLKPRFKWGVTDHDDIRPFEVQPLSSDVFTERQRLLSDMQLVTGINPYVSGSDLSSVDQNTATGVTALQEVASRLLRFKAAQIQHKGYQRAFEMWGDMTQQFLSDTLTIEIAPGSWTQVTPQQIAGHFRYTIEGSDESLSRQTERSEAIQLMNSFAPLAQVVPNINWALLLERVGATFNIPDPSKLLLPQQPPPQPAAPNGFGGQQMLPQAQQGGYGLAGQGQMVGGQQLDPRIAAMVTNGGR